MSQKLLSWQQLIFPISSRVTQDEEEFCWPLTVYEIFQTKQLPAFLFVVCLELHYCSL